MLTKLVNAAACREFVQNEDGNALVGLLGGTLPAASQPGYFQGSLLLTAETDGRGWTGRLILRAADYEETISYTVPPGARQTAFVPAITVPILKEGLLSGRLIDDVVRAKPLTATWKLVFGEGAPALPEASGAEILEMTRLIAQQMAGAYKGGAAVH